MSVTFWCPEAPTEAFRPYEDEPDFVEHRSTLPELNVSEHNAKALLGMLGADPAGNHYDRCGTVELADLPAFIAQIDRALEHPEYRASYLEPAVTTVSVSRLAQESRCEVPAVASSMLVPAAADVELQDEATLTALSMFSSLPREQVAQVLQNRAPRKPDSRLQELLEKALQPKEALLNVVPKGATMHYPGRPDAYLVARLKSLKSLCEQARQAGYYVSWG